MFELQPGKAQPWCYVQDVSRQAADNARLRSNPNVSRADTATKLRVSHDSLTTPHLRAFQ